MRSGPAGAGAAPGNPPLGQRIEGHLTLDAETSDLDGGHPNNAQRRISPFFARGSLPSCPAGARACSTPCPQDAQCHILLPDVDLSSCGGDFCRAATLDTGYTDPLGLCRRSQLEGCAKKRLGISHQTGWLRSGSSKEREVEGEGKMRKKIIPAVLLMTALLFGASSPALARRGENFHGHGGARHAWGGRHGGRVFHGHGGGDGGVVIGPDIWWGAPWWWGPAYPDYASPYYAPPVASPPPPPVYFQQEPAPPPIYWYYCPDSRAYYPYVKKCPSGWLTVVPPTTAPPTSPSPSPTSR